MVRNDIPYDNSLASQAWISRYAKALCTSTAGPLAGLSFAAKDNIDTLGLPTTAACPEFAFSPTAHATVVRRLLGCGASLVGKTNLDQFACGLNGTRSPYGTVPNALNPLYVSGGSSSGSAYVVATGQVDFALGTDTAGSGRVPQSLLTTHRWPRPQTCCMKARWWPSATLPFDRFSTRTKRPLLSPCAASLQKAGPIAQPICAMPKRSY